MGSGKALEAVCNGALYKFTFTLLTTLVFKCFVMICLTVDCSSIYVRYLMFDAWIFAVLV